MNMMDTFADVLRPTILRAAIPIGDKNLHQISCTFSIATVFQKSTILTEKPQNGIHVYLQVELFRTYPHASDAVQQGCSRFEATFSRFSVVVLAQVSPFSSQVLPFPEGS